MKEKLVCVKIIQINLLLMQDEKRIFKKKNYCKSYDHKTFKLGIKVSHRQLSLSQTLNVKK